MAWSWSHSQEAYWYARLNLARKSLEDLRVMFAEWEARDGSSDNFDRAKYDAALVRAAKLPRDVLVDAIYEHAEEQSTCTNGGHRAWMCPHGCDAHMVPFDPPFAFVTDTDADGVTREVMLIDGDAVASLLNDRVIERHWDGWETGPMDCEQIPRFGTTFGAVWADVEDVINNFVEA